MQKILLTLAFSLSLPALASQVEQEAIKNIQSTEKDRTNLSVTAYNKGISVVRDRRRTVLLDGEQKLTFMDVASQIRPETVNLRSITQPGSLHILEQNYEYDLISPSKLLEKYVGSNVELINFSKDIGFEKVIATLLSTNEGPVYKIGDKIYLGHPGNIVLPTLPDNLIAKPSLVWLLDNKTPDQEIELSYITGGMSWTADYVVTLSRDDKKINLEGWVTLNNHSGTSYPNTQLTLVAGDIHTAEATYKAAPYAMRSMQMAGADSALEQESFGDFHLYRLPRRTTILDNQQKQVNLLTSQDIDVEKIYEYYGNGNHWYQTGVQKNQKVSALLTFKNSESNHLGVPLPAGVMRVYQEDSTGVLHFGGEDRINHTPRDESVSIKLGNAFDILIDRTQTNFKKISDRVHQVKYELVIRNHKDIPVTVNIFESLSHTQWEILSSSHKYNKRDAATAHFAVVIPAHDQVTLSYHAQITQ